MSEKQPQLGEWWQFGEMRVYVIGPAIEIDEYAVQEIDLEVHGRHLNGWEYLPDCTGFDWKPPSPLTEVLPGLIESYTTVEDTAPLQDGDLLVDGGLCYAVPSQYFGQSARDVKIPGYEYVFFLRDKFIASPKAEPVEPALVLETLAHMRDQFAALCKRVERLERSAEPF
jgi:hypothetical protein